MIILYEVQQAHHSIILSD